MLPLTYFLKVIVCSSVFLGYYLIALKNKRFHQYNRFYLLFSVVASWFIPLIKFQLNTTEKLQQPIYQAFNYIAESNAAFDFQPIKKIETSFNWMQLIPILYIIVVLIIFGSTIISFLKIFSIYKKYPKQKVNNITLINTQESSTPFSFFNNIFWNTNIDINTATGNQILQHELTHVNEKHSLDKIFMQLNILLGWFNPCFWLIKSELEMIHEFIADNKAIANANAADFASMLLVATFPTHQYKLTNPFFFSPIKRRLTMLTQNNNPRLSYVRRLIILPLLSMVVLLFAFKKQEVTSTTILLKKYKVVIDAGHGGQDIGTTGIDGKTYEKDIALAIAKAIKTQNNNANLELVLTREDDHFDNPKQKADFANKQNADLYVSIHCSDAGKNNEINGTETFVVHPNKNNGFIDASKILAQSVNSNLKNHFANNGIKQRAVGIWVLQATNCPAILVETGFLSNKKDLDILKNVEQQNIMAKDILKGIENYLALQEDTKISTALIKDSATAAEMAEYLDIAAKYKQQLKKYMEYNFEKITKDEEEKLFTIFCKMNKEQQETLKVYFVKPMKPSPKIVPTTTQLNTWANNKKYGIWIDGENQIANNKLNKYSPNSFSQFDVSRLEKKAVNYGKHYYQVNLMTNKYYEEYVKKSLEKKYELCWGSGLKTSLYAKAGGRIEK